MLFGKNYFIIKMSGKKVKIDTDKTEFTITVKNGKASLTVEAEPEVIDECSDFCDCCNECNETEIPEVVVEDNKPTKTTKKKTLDTVC